MAQAYGPLGWDSAEDAKLKAIKLHDLENQARHTYDDSDTNAEIEALRSDLRTDGFNE